MKAAFLLITFFPFLLFNTSLVGLTNMIARQSSIMMGMMKYIEFIFFLSCLWIEKWFSIQLQKYFENKQKHYTIQE